ncbi:MAG: iron-containing alcohol dehydrogenase [Oscillospiraceae bacterium]|nr:iron-containing alcohol dehydrogenase [Oscillospiraceae bacterium]
MKEFSCGTRIISGSGAVTALKNMGARRLMLVTDPYFVKNGTAARIAAAAGAETTEIFDRVEPDPSVTLAAEGTAKVREFEPDMIVALGGGSAMDCAKAMAYFSGTKARLVAIPTTSGSGSEVTDFAILTHNSVKHPLVDRRLRPEAAILDDELLKGLPPSLVADAGFDVLSHALEAYVGTNAGAVTDALARDAFCAAFAALPASFNGRTDVRLRIHIAATMAGMAFTQAGLGLCHALSHSLGGLYHVPHGRLNAILLPAVIDCNAHAASEKYAGLSRAAGLGGSADVIAVRNLKNGLVRLRTEMRLPATLAQAGVEPRQVWHDMNQIVAAAMADPCCDTNPMKVEDFMVRKILEEVTGRV